MLTERLAVRPLTTLLFLHYLILVQYTENLQETSIPSITLPKETSPPKSTPNTGIYFIPLVKLFTPKHA